MVHTHSSPDAPPEEQAYSHGVAANGFLFTAGQVPMTPEGELVEGSAAERTDRIMQNIGAILAETGLGFEDVVKTTAYFDDGYPARDVVEVADLPAGATIELVAVAATE